MMNRIRGASSMILFHQIMHYMILLLLAWVMFTYLSSPTTLIKLRQFLDQMMYWVVIYIPYVHWLASASHTPELTRAWIEMTYLGFFMLFLNLFFAAFHQFSGLAERSYVLSFNGFADFLEENIFSKLSPSVSLLTSSELLWGRAARGSTVIDAKSIKRVVIIFLKKYGIGYYGGLAFAGVFFFPWVAFNKVNSTGMNSVPFELAVVVFCYTQVRLVFELAMLLLFVKLPKNENKGE